MNKACPFLYCAVLSLAIKVISLNKEFLKRILLINYIQLLCAWWRVNCCKMKSFNFILICHCFEYKAHTITHWFLNSEGQVWLKKKKKKIVFHKLLWSYKRVAACLSTVIIMFHYARCSRYHFNLWYSTKICEVPLIASRFMCSLMWVLYSLMKSRVWSIEWVIKRPLW